MSYIVLGRASLILNNWLYILKCINDLEYAGCWSRSEINNKISAAKSIYLCTYPATETPGKFCSFPIVPAKGSRAKQNSRGERESICTTSVKDFSELIAKMKSSQKLCQFLSHVFYLWNLQKGWLISIGCVNMNQNNFPLHFSTNDKNSLPVIFNLFETVTITWLRTAGDLSNLTSYTVYRQISLLEKCCLTLTITSFIFVI